MPAARPSSSKLRKSKSSNQHSHSKPPSSKTSKTRPSDAKRVACRAWWCDSSFTRRADMLKHVGSEHFGKRFYCIICYAVMKQQSNLNTHINAHFGNHCTLCSCGQGFTDPSACTRHRDATGHEEGITYRKPRPTIIEPVGVQHLAGLALTVEMISDPTFVPPSFDESYHLKGKPKPKAVEKYNSRDYLVTNKADVPTIPSAQGTALSLVGEAPPARYREYLPTECPTPVQTEISVDKLDLGADFSYDVELLQDRRYNRVPVEEAYPEYHGPSTTYPTHNSQAPPESYYTPPGAISPLYPHPTATSHTATISNPYPQQYLGNYTMATHNHLLPPRPFAESRVSPEYLEMPHHSQMSYPLAGSTPHSFNRPRDFFEDMGFGMHVPNRFQQPEFQPQPVDFNQVYQPAY